MKLKPSRINFDRAFASSNIECFWDNLKFSEMKVEPVFRYVGWIDVMGASNLMLRSPEAVSRSIGCLHEAVLRATAALPERDSVELHPLADGVYVVAPEYHAVSTIISRVFRSYARKYLSWPSEARKCLIRSAIAFGRGVNTSLMRAKLESVFSNAPSECIPGHYLGNIVHGTAFSLAHDAERKAPPFGVIHDNSLRLFGITKSGKTLVSWPFLRWWCEGQQATPTRRNFARMFSKCVLDHFDWVEKHPIESGMHGDDIEKKIQSYRRLAVEYFDIISDVGQGADAEK